MDSAGWLTKKRQKPKTPNRTKNLTSSNHEIHPLDTAVLFQQRITKYMSKKPEISDANLSSVKNTNKSWKEKDVADNLYSSTQDTLITKHKSDPMSNDITVVQKIDCDQMESDYLPDPKNVYLTQPMKKVKDATDAKIETATAKLCIEEEIHLLSAKENTRSVTSFLTDLPNKCRPIRSPVFWKGVSSESNQDFNRYNYVSNKSKLLSQNDDIPGFQSDTELQFSLSTETCNKYVPFIPLQCASDFTLSSQCSIRNGHSSQSAEASEKNQTCNNKPSLQCHSECKLVHNQCSIEDFDSQSVKITENNCSLPLPCASDFKLHSRCPDEQNSQSVKMPEYDLNESLNLDSPYLEEPVIYREMCSDFTLSF